MTGKVKAVEIARELNLSKATVSLALNNKPGVSYKTKEAVYRCMEELSRRKEGIQLSANKKMIEIIMVNIGQRKEEWDLWSKSMAVYDREIKKRDYTLGITYIDLKKMESEEIQKAIQDANRENVAGVILVATEMSPEDYEPLRAIRKPMVVCDNEFTYEHHCVAIDNVSAVRNVVDMLIARGCRKIVYLGNSQEIYNFRQRRAGFRAGLRKNGLPLEQGSIYLIGDVIENIHTNSKEYLKKNRLPDAFIFENYQVSLGMMRALADLGIRIPQDISLVGIDEIPGYMQQDYLLTTVKVDHTERCQIAMMFLEQEIKGEIATKFKVYSNCEMIYGNSVR